MKFTDRNREIELLQTALRKQRRSFVVVYGRRRLGKSTLVKRVLSDRDVYFMADLSESSNQRHLLAMTVAAPRYWELREESTDIDSALRHFCINPHGLLYDEVVHVLRDDMRDLVQATTILTAIHFKIPECEIRSLSEGKTNQTVFMFDPFS